MNILVIILLQIIALPKFVSPTPTSQHLTPYNFWLFQDKNRFWKLDLNVEKIKDNLLWQLVTILKFKKLR